MFAPVQAMVKQASATTVVTTAVTTTSGNLLIAVVTCFTNKIGATPVSDSKGNTWATAIGSTGTTNGFVGIYYAMNIAGGAGHTVTFTPTGSDFISITVLEITGAALTSAFSTSSGSVTNSTTHTSPSITSGTTDEILVGAGSASTAAEGTPVLNQAGWYSVSQISGTAFEGMSIGFRFVPPATTDTYSYTLSAAQNVGIAIAGFKGVAVHAGGSSTFFGG